MYMFLAYCQLVDEENMSKTFLFHFFSHFFGIFEPCLNIMSLLYDYCLIYGKYDRSFSYQSQPGEKYSCQYVTRVL